MHYFDAHCHLQDFPDEDALAAALDAAGEAGADRLLCCGTCPEDWGRVLEIAERYEGIVPFFGLHPWREPQDGWRKKLEDFLRRVPSGVGETGLDGPRGLPGHEERFAEQLEISNYFNRPAAIHCVKSWGRLLETLRAVKPRSFMLHSYSGSAELVPELAALGGYLSFGGELMDPRRERLRAALAAVPRERLLFETESPEPGGPPWRSGPAGIAEVTAFAAGLLGVQAGELAAQALANCERFVGGIK